jgi:hypothetical protein
MMSLYIERVCSYAECCGYFNFMPSVVILSVAVLRVAMLIVIMLSAVMLRVAMLNVVAQ